MRLLRYLFKWRAAVAMLSLWVIGLAMVALGGFNLGTIRPDRWPAAYPWRGVVFSAQIVTLQIVLLSLIVGASRVDSHLWRFAVAVLFFVPVTLLNYFFRVVIWDDPGFVTALFDWALIVDAVLLVLLSLSIVRG
jgi:hypothetical protein